ncbi:MAG: hypothetical protein K0S23_1226 [Fluviicola sp.]|jgi:hypothetical protein|uniref:hypothetical protein n=1 Tax=Fluviicola sp. TaxID=1917219 RepID=UPI002608DCF1|nr:hypothetical protein [Fluviicola sp.]MDF3026919.1 hypothetical protein [Fluviicola sp.]
MFILSSDTSQTLFSQENINSGFFWPVISGIALAIILGVFALQRRKRIKRKEEKAKELLVNINYQESRLHNEDNQQYLIVRLKIINRSTDPINKMQLTTNPELPICKTIQRVIKFDSNPKMMIMPYIEDIIKDVIFAHPLNVPALDYIEGNVILAITTIPSDLLLRFSYLDKIVVQSLKTNKIQQES